MAFTVSKNNDEVRDLLTGLGMPPKCVKARIILTVGDYPRIEWECLVDEKQLKLLRGSIMVNPFTVEPDSN